MNNIEIKDCFSDHARKRIKRRFKKYSIDEIIKDFENSKFLHTSYEKHISIGLIAKYAVSNDGVIVSVLPISNKTKNKQFKIKNAKPKKLYNIH